MKDGIIMDEVSNAIRTTFVNVKSYNHTPQLDMVVDTARYI